jgi:hypothetical protein
MKRTNQKGAALIFAMIFVLALTIMAASLMFLSQSETWASMNYRLMTESRYGAEAGLHAAAAYLTSNNYQPGSAGDPLAAYVYDGVSPVTAGGNPVILGVTMNSLSPNYPVASVQTGFNALANGSVTAGINTVNYSVNAELLAMRKLRQCLVDNTQIAQLWKLTSHGDIGGARNSEVEVSALLESHVVPCFNYAAYASGTGCGSLNFSGGGTIDSYDSSTFAGVGVPATQTYMGNLGSNGNLNTAPNTVVNGTFSSPDKGVGACGAGGVTDALSGNTTTAITGCSQGPTNCVAPPGLVTLPQAVTFPLPTIPSSTPNPSPNENSTVTLDPCVQNCPHNGGGGGVNANGSYGDITLAGNDTITFQPGTSGGNCVPGIYYVNSISLAGNATMTVAPCPGTGPNANPPSAPVYQPVIINVVGQGQATPLDIGGNGISNPSFNSSLVQIQYNGTGAINLHGNGSQSAVIYAPNSNISMSGNAAFYGSVIGNTLSASGGPVTIHYDRALQNNLVNVANWTMDTFTWSKY